MLNKYLLFFKLNKYKKDRKANTILSPNLLFPVTMTILLLGLFFHNSAFAFPEKKITVSGKTMGTYYHITVMAKKLLNPSLLKLKIDKRLNMVNQSMSTYMKNSEISRFNDAPPNTPVRISNDFITVFKTAASLHNQTRGAWDGTVKPLVDLWGFGKHKVPEHIPSQRVIEKKLALTGFHKINISEHNLVKTISGITLDLGSIAKGFGVDAVSRLLTHLGHKNHLVEIGGEIMAVGVKTKNIPWTVGISRPEKKFSAQTLYKVINLKNQAMATSGDYRNFITLNGKTYSHVINPETGFPVNNHVVSTSVIAPDCTFADGLATALMVMGPEKGIKLVNTLSSTECLIVVRKADGALRDFFSKDFLAHDSSR